MITHTTRYEINADTQGPDGPWFFLYFDGSCYPNPGGKMGMGWLLYEGRGPLSLGADGSYPATPPTLDISNRGAIAAYGAESGGPGTNNRAEYHALIAGLCAAHRIGVRRLLVVGDSQLVVRQTAGHWRCFDAKLKPLCAKAKLLCRAFTACKFRHAHRAENDHADLLAAQKPDTPLLVIRSRHQPWRPKGLALSRYEQAMIRWMYAFMGIEPKLLAKIYEVDSGYVCGIGKRGRAMTVDERDLVTYPGPQEGFFQREDVNGP